MLVIISDFTTKHFWLGVGRSAVRSPKSVRQESPHGMFRFKVLGSVLMYFVGYNFHFKYCKMFGLK